MITTNRLPLLQRSRLRPVINYDIRNKRYGTLLIMNTMDYSNLKGKLGTVNIEYNSVIRLTMREKSLKLISTILSSVHVGKSVV